MCISTSNLSKKRQDFSLALRSLSFALPLFRCSATRKVKDSIHGPCVALPTNILRSMDVCLCDIQKRNIQLMHLLLHALHFQNWSHCHTKNIVHSQHSIRHQLKCLKCKSHLRCVVFYCRRCCCLISHSHFCRSRSPLQLRNYNTGIHDKNRRYMELLQPIKISAREENKNVCTHKNIYLRWRKKKYDSSNIELRMKGSNKKSRHETKFIFDYIYKVHGRIRWEYKISIEKQLPQFTIYNNANHVREAKWRK